jgi:hypothetical protein
MILFNSIVFYEGFSTASEKLTVSYYRDEQDLELFLKNLSDWQILSV